MTRQYFNDHKNLHTDDINVVEHPRSGVKERSSWDASYQEKVLKKASRILANRKLLTYVGTAVGLGVIIGTASLVAYRLRKRKSPTYLVTKWFNSRF